MDYEGLEDLLPDELFNHPDCFESRTYWKWEEEVATPELEQRGFKNISWLDGERDSFGPLTRICSCVDADGKRKLFIYG